MLGWGWLEGDPVAEARLAVELCQRYDLDGYIANAELPYESADIWKSQAFVDEFRRLAPRAPLAISGLGAAYSPWVREFDYAAWLRAGAVFMPQCYPNQYGEVYTVPNCIAHADRAGIPRDRVVPTLGTYRSTYSYDPLVYAHDLQAAKTLGFNFFLGESATPTDYQVLGQAIVDHGIALR